MSSSRVRALIIGAIALAVIIGGLAIAGVFSSGSQTAAPVSQPTDADQAFGPVGTTETVPCPESLAAGAAFQAAGNEVEGETYSCGVVVVPENHDEPDGRTIELFYRSCTAPAMIPRPPRWSTWPAVRIERQLRADGQHVPQPEPGPDPTDPRHHRLRPARHRLLQLPAVRAVRVTLGILQDRDKNPEIAETIEDLQNTNARDRLRSAARQSVRGRDEAARGCRPQPVQQHRQRPGPPRAGEGPRLHRRLQPLRHELRNPARPACDAHGRRGGPVP